MSVVLTRPSRKFFALAADQAAKPNGAVADLPLIGHAPANFCNYASIFMTENNVGPHCAEVNGMQIRTTDSARAYFQQQFSLPARGLGTSLTRRPLSSPTTTAVMLSFIT